MRKYSFIFLLVSCCLIFGDGRSTIKKVRDAIHQIKPFGVEFSVQVMSDGDVDFEESGTILFETTKKVKWVYLDPEYKVFLLQNNHYQFYDKENEQLTRGELSKNNQQWIWSVLLTPATSEYVFSSGDNRKKIHIKNVEESFELEVTVNKDFLPEIAVQHDPSGVKLIYHFKNYRKKIKIEEGEFSIEIPDDIEIIEMD